MYIIQKKKSITVWKTLKYHNGKRAEFSTIQKAKSYLDKYLDENEAESVNDFRYMDVETKDTFEVTTLL